MEIAQSLVCAAYQSLGFFVIEGIKVGQREIDLLAIKLDRNSRVIERLHIEVQIGTSPIGPLRGQAKLGKSLKEPLVAAKDYIDKKFKHKSIIGAVKNYFGNHEYRKVLVYGKLKKPEQLNTLHKFGIETISIANLIKKAQRSNPVHELKRTISVFEVILS